MTKLQEIRKLEKRAFALGIAADIMKELGDEETAEKLQEQSEKDWEEASKLRG
jgi:hypothetical protein